MGTRPSRVKQTSGSGVELTMRQPEALSCFASTCAHARLVLNHLDVACLAVLRQRHKQLQADKAPRPLGRSRERIKYRAILFAWHVRDLGAEGFGHRLPMAAEEHSASHGNREPLMRVAGDRVGIFDAGEIRPEGWREDGAPAPRGIDVKP